MKIKYLAIPIVALVVMGLAFLSTPLTVPVNNNEGLKYTGYVCVYKNDQLVECKHNLITSWGKDAIENVMANGVFLNITNISIANSTAVGGQVVADTILQGQYNASTSPACGMAPTTNVLYWSAGIGAWNISYQWTSACDLVTVNATGLSNGTNGAANQLFAETTFTSVTLQTNDRLNVTWGLQVS